MACSKSNATVPLIPARKKYSYDESSVEDALEKLVTVAKKKKLNLEIPKTDHLTRKLAHVLCSMAKADCWTRECDEILADQLALREHHSALLSHKIFVTMVGAVVARALEQATKNNRLSLDLLSDRYYVRSIVTHDTTKTSKMEASAYSGIMAAYMEKAAGLEVPDLTTATTEMANFGFKHHYEHNPHHPEHSPAGEMSDVDLVEAIVDGLACILERVKTHTNTSSWLSMYKVDRFQGHNKTFAEKIMIALQTYVTRADYEALVRFRDATLSLVGESVPWSRIEMTACCALSTERPSRGISSILLRDKH